MRKGSVFLRKMDISKAYIIFLVIFDACAINIASILSMTLRFDGALGRTPLHYYQPIVDNMVLNTTVTVLIFVVFKLYKSVWRYVGTQEVILILAATATSSLMNFGIYFLKHVEIYRSYYILYWMILSALIISSRYVYRLLRFTYRAGKKSETTKNIMIVGAGDACFLAMHEIDNSTKLNGKVRLKTIHMSEEAL